MKRTPVVGEKLWHSGRRVTVLEEVVYVQESYKRWADDDFYYRTKERVKVQEDESGKVILAGRGALSSRRTQAVIKEIEIAAREDARTLVLKSLIGNKVWHLGSRGTVVSVRDEDSGFHFLEGGDLVIEMEDSGNRHLVWGWWVEEGHLSYAEYKEAHSIRD